MSWRSRITAAAIAATLGISGGSVALGASSTHWTSAHCKSYVKAFLKRHHNHPTKKQIATANKVLKKHGCTNKA